MKLWSCITILHFLYNFLKLDYLHHYHYLKVANYNTIQHCIYY